MTQQVPYEQPNNNQTMQICQRCFEHVALKICNKCGCPLCTECWPKHICNRPDLEDKEDKIIN